MEEQMRFRKEPEVNLGLAARTGNEQGAAGSGLAAAGAAGALAGAAERPAQALQEPEPKVATVGGQGSKKAAIKEVSGGNQAARDAPDAGDKFSIELDGTKSDDLIVGVEVNLSDKKTLLVERILNREWSLMYNWNIANPDRQVRIGDRITRVNHIEGSAIKMINQCKMVDGNRIITMEVMRRESCPPNSGPANGGPANAR